MTEMWDGATEPLQAEADRRRFHYALAKADAHWPFLAAAQSEGEYAQRKAMVGQAWEAAVHDEFDRRFAALRLESALSAKTSEQDWATKGRLDMAEGGERLVMMTYEDLQRDGAFDESEEYLRGAGLSGAFGSRRKEAGSFRDMMEAENKIVDRGTCKHCGKEIVKKGGLWYESSDGNVVAGDICIKNKGTVRQYGGYHEPTGKKTASGDKAISEMTDAEIADELANSTQEWDTPGDEREETLVEEQQKRRTTSAKTASPSDVCPECGAHMEDVQVKDGILRAKCDHCGWTGMKRQSAKTAAETTQCSECSSPLIKSGRACPGCGRNPGWLHNNGLCSKCQHASDKTSSKIAADDRLACPYCDGTLRGDYDHVECDKCSKGYDPKSLMADMSEFDGPLSGHVLRIDQQGIARVASAMASLHEATEQDLLDAVAALDYAEGDLDKAAAFFHHTPGRERYPEERGARIPSLTDEQNADVVDRGHVLKQRHLDERNEEQASKKRHDEYYSAHPNEPRPTRASKQAASPHADTARDLLGHGEHSQSAQDLLHAEVAKDLLAGPGGLVPEHLMHVRPVPPHLDPRGLHAGAKTAAVGDNIYGDEIQPDLAPETRIPVTTRPRVTPELPRQTEFTMPSGPEGLDPANPYDPAPTQRVDRHNFSQPTFEQAVAAKVAKIAKRIEEDNPHLSAEATRRLAMQALSSYPEIVRN